MARCSSFSHGEPGTQRDEGPGEDPAQPGRGGRSRQEVGSHGCSKYAVGGEDDQGDQHENAAQPQHPRVCVRLASTDELWQKRKEEDRQLWVEDVDQDRGSDHLRMRIEERCLLGLRGHPSLERRPRHVEKVCHAEILQSLKRHCAGVQQCGETSERCEHLRDDPERASKRRPPRRRDGRAQAPPPMCRRLQCQGLRQRSA